MELNPLGLIDKMALQHLQSKKLEASFSHYDIWLDQHAYAFTVAKMMDEDLLAETRQALADALANGTSFREFKQRLKPFLMSRGWWGEQVMIDPMDDEPKMVQLGSTRRLKTIFQTNIATAHASARWQRIQANKRGLPYLRYNGSHAQHQREAHKRYYGLVLPVEHPIWQQIFPPNGYGCKCSVTQLTRGQAERAGISQEPDFEFVEVENPRTGEVVRVPRDIEPSFAHNHVNRQKAVLDLATEKHGEVFAEKLLNQQEKWVSERYTMPVKDIPVIALPDNPPAEEIERLTTNYTANNTSLHEARAAAAWQIVMKQKLEIFDLPTETGVGKPDYLIVNTELSRELWQTLDFMFTENPDNTFKLQKFNDYFAHTPEQWLKKQQQILNHLEKADIVPLDMRHLNALNRAKLLNFVLSLSEEQKKKLQLLVRETK